jgi:DNA-binding MarR family transcriptional regulator
VTIVEGKTGKEKILDIETWLPHQFSVVANYVSTTLENEYADRYGLSVVGWRVMSVLGGDAPLSAKALAVRLALDQVTTSRAISQLMGLGFISRRVDKKDRRRVALQLSQNGWRVYQVIAPLAVAIEESLLDCLNNREKASFKKAMGKLVDASARQLGSRGDDGSACDQ